MVAYYFHYEGFKVFLWGGQSGLGSVGSITVLSPNYRLGGRVGLRVGDSKADVERASARHRSHITFDTDNEGNQVASIHPTVWDIIIVSFDENDIVTSIVVSQRP